MNDNKYGSARSGADGPRASRLRRSVYVSAVVALVVVASTLAATPAHAGGGVGAVGQRGGGELDPAGVEQVLRAVGAVADVGSGSTGQVEASNDRFASPNAVAPDGSSPNVARPEGEASDVSTARVTLKAGLTVATGANTLQIQPVAARGAKALSPSGLAVYGNTPESAFALSSAATGGNAGYVVISGPTAPDAYRFAFTVDGRPAVLKLAADGGVEVYSATGALVNSIVPAWAKDANGAAVATSYSVSRNILVQRVSHAGAAYPVVADPRVRCDGLWCTLELTRNETRLMAASALSPGIACRFLGPGAGACAALLISGWAQANIALSRGQCTGVRVWQANMVSYPHLAYIRCYA